MKKLLGRTSMVVITLLLCHSLVHAYRLPATGETRCFDSSGTEISCANSGQDGAYIINPMSFTDNGDYVTDNNTGLMWQKCSVGQNYDATCSGTALTGNWYEAAGIADPTYNPSGVSACSYFSNGGFTDWRLPTKKELLSIVDYSYPSPGPTIQTGYFPHTQAAYYWTSVPYFQNRGRIVDFYSGTDGTDYKTNNNYVRCVRGGQTPQNFTDSGETVTDNNTGLVWQKCTPGQNNDSTCSGDYGTIFNWDQAISYCKSLSLGGASDWRLPNVKELESLTDDTLTSEPMINTIFFPNTFGMYYWTSTTDMGNVSNAWPVSFYTGGVGISSSKAFSNNIFTRCVRGGGVNVCTYASIEIDGVAPPYATIHDAYAAATDGQFIEMQALDFTEADLNLDRGISVALKGGYACGFSSNPGFTTIHGEVTITSGIVTVEKVILSK